MNCANSARSAVAFLRRQRHSGSENPQSPIPNPNPESHAWGLKQFASDGGAYKSAELIDRDEFCELCALCGCFPTSSASQRIRKSPIPNPESQSQIPRIGLKQFATDGGAYKSAELIDRDEFCELCALCGCFPTSSAS